ncbi:MAG TPA: ABC transporter permease [Candidatus Polarisedimenticolia bacterium]|nr:ABC transporter permease [Candidatus Polarisedimenticolia bacterium]
MPIFRWWSTARLRLRSLLLGRRVEEEMEEELRYHLENKIEEGLARGLSPEEARYAALRAMNGLEQQKERMRDARGIRWLTEFVADLRYAIRSLGRSPGLTGFVILTLAVAIGMCSATFSGIDSLVFRPYPVRDPGDIVTLVSTTQDNRFGQFSYGEYRDIRDGTRSYDGVIASSTLSLVGFSAEPGAMPRARGGMMVSGNYFRVLGVEPQVGRGFRDSEDQVPGRDAVVVLGHDFWGREFGADPSAVGRTVRLNGRDFTVVGVAPESFPGMQVFYRPDLYMPLAMARLFSADPKKDFFVDRDARELTIRARLRHDTPQQEAQAEITALAQGFEREYPRTNRDRGAEVNTQLQMRARADDPNWKFMVITNVLTLSVLLVACTNVAGILLSRARSRTREIALRLALGAGRLRLVRLLLTESLVLACLGGLGGIVVGDTVLDWLARFSLPSELPTVPPFQMDGRVMTIALLLSLVSAVVCGLTPALQATRTDLVAGLKTADVDEPGRKRLWGRNGLVVAQVSTSLMLLAAAFLMYRGFQQEMTEGMGYVKSRLLLARFDPRLVQYDVARTRRFYDQLVAGAREMPGVVNATLTENPPLILDTFAVLAFVPEGVPMPRDRENFTSLMDAIDPGFFETMGVPILRGRGFLPSDTEDTPRVAVVNEQLANHYWPGEEVLGKQIRLENATGERVEIVGVARTIKYRTPNERPADFVYLPRTQHPLPRMILMLKTSGDPLQIVAPLKEVVRGLDADMPVLSTRSYEDLYRYHVVEGPGAAIRLVGSLGAIGLLLTIAGLYGLIAYNVSRRTREIGIRMALGAQPRDVLRLVMRKGLVLVGMGTGIGLAMGFAVEKMMNSMLFNLGGVDLTVYAMVVPAMLLATMAAAYLPARRAARIAPTEALRCE